MDNKTLYIPPRIEEMAFYNENGFAYSGSAPSYSETEGSWSLQ